MAHRDEEGTGVGRGRQRSQLRFVWGSRVVPSGRPQVRACLRFGAGDRDGYRHVFKGRGGRVRPGRRGRYEVTHPGAQRTCSWQEVH